MCLFYQKIASAAIFDSNCNFIARFVATALKDSLAGFGGHASAKAVHSGALASLGLICSLWHNARHCIRFNNFCQAFY